MRLISKRTGDEFNSFSEAREWVLRDVQERQAGVDVTYKFSIDNTIEEAWLNVWLEHEEWVGAGFDIVEDPSQAI